MPLLSAVVEAAILHAIVPLVGITRITIVITR